MESNSSSLPPTETPQSIDTSTTDVSSRKRAREISSTKPPVVPKKRSSPYWEHCEKATRKATDGSTQQIGICKYCKSEIPANLGSTSGLKNHLVKRCKLSPLYEVTASEKGQTILSNETMGQTSQVVPHYFNQKRCELKITQYIEKRSNSFNLLNWWKGCESKYPILSCIAKDIFAIPSSTVASESAFSLGKRVVDPFRTSLSPKMVEALVCTNDWLKAEEFDVFKDPTDDDLQLYKEIEEIEKNANTTQDCSLNNSSSSSLSVI